MARKFNFKRYAKKQTKRINRILREFEKIYKKTDDPKTKEELRKLIDDLNYHLELAYRVCYKNDLTENEMNDFLDMLSKSKNVQE